MPDDKNKITPAPEPAKQKVVQTFAEDMAGVLEGSPGEVIKKIIHGEEEREAARKNLSPAATKNRLLLLFGFVAIFVGSLIFVFIFIHRKPATVSIAPQFVPLIFTDQTDFLEAADQNKDQLAHTFRAAMDLSKVKVGGVDGIYLTESKKVINLWRFLELMEANFYPNHKFVGDNFLMGFANNTTPAAPLNKDFFILLKMDSVADIFPAMKTWEAKMFSDLHGFFNIPISPTTGPLLTKDFEDGIVANKNARILYDANKNIVLMYVFPDDNSVIITNSNQAVEEIILRLAQNQIKKD